MGITEGRGAPGWADRLRRALEGDVLTDAASRGRYATDASIYQCFPAAVVLPKSAADLAAALEIASEEGIGATVRGGGTSTAGHTLTDGIVIDCSKYLNRFLFHDEGSRSCAVEPGITLDEVNRRLRGERLWFPVDTGLGHAATIGGMLGNNASGMRALRYGRMADNVIAVDALLAGGAPITLRDAGESEPDGQNLPDVILDLLQFGEQKEAELRALWGEDRLPPSGADLGCLLPSSEPQRLARLLAGAEGQFAVATRIELRLTERPRRQALGICRFRTLKAALATVPAIVALGASAVELLDAAMLDLGAAGPRRGIPLEPQLLRALHGEPEAVLIVEFGENNPVENSRRLKALDDLVAPVSGPKLPLVEVMGAKAQAAVWRFRRQAIERALALRSAARPVAFLDTCAVPLPHLAEFGDAIVRQFRQADVRALIYGHAGAGCLHVRPALDLRHTDDLAPMRDLASAILALLRKFDGRLAGGDGLGLAGLPLFRAVEPDAAELMAQVKAILDPRGILNPGKLTGGLRPDDAGLFRSAAQPASAGEVRIAAEHANACTGLALCRRSEGLFACPSWAVTRNERDSPRGRANTVRLALSGQIGHGAGLGEPDVLDAMSLCVSCKACRSICKRAVDIPRIKAEALAASQAAHAPSRGETFYAHLPFHLERARDWRYILRLRDLLPGLPRLSERWLGLAADRAWPAFRGARFRAPPFDTAAPVEAKTVALFADCLNQAFEPGVLQAAAKLLHAGGYEVATLPGSTRAEPLCCGRTLYDAGLFDAARAHAQRLVAAIEPLGSAGVPVVSLEPACALMLRDEYRHLLPGAPVPEIKLFEEYLLGEHAAGRFSAPFKPVEERLIVHPHCHERAHGVASATIDMLRLVPGLEVSEAPPGCCGLNGIFGYTPETFETSLAMAELALFPALRKAGRDALAAASGFSCRTQIRDGLGRPVSHPAVFLLLSLNAPGETG